MVKFVTCIRFSSFYGTRRHSTMDRSEPRSDGVLTSSSGPLEWTGPQVLVHGMDLTRLLIGLNTIFHISILPQFQQYFSLC